MRIVQLLVTLILTSLITACDKPSASTPAGSASETSIVVLHSRLSRFLDKHWATRTTRPVLLAKKSDAIVDPDGKTVRLSMEEWATVTAKLQDTPDRKTAIRALPAGGPKHDDGLGRVRRNAWFLGLTADGKLEATFVKALEGESE